MSSVSNSLILDNIAAVTSLAVPFNLNISAAKFERLPHTLSLEDKFNTSNSTTSSPKPANIVLSILEPPVLRYQLQMNQL